MKHRPSAKQKSKRGKPKMKKVDDMERGITAIVAVVLLIAIAVIAAVGIYFWTAGISTKQPTPEKPVAIVANPVGEGKVLIANLGQNVVNTSTLRTSDPNLSIECQNQTIPPGQQVLCTVKGTPSSNEIAIWGSGTGTTQTPINNQRVDNPPVIESVVDNTNNGDIELHETLVVNATVIDDVGISGVWLVLSNGTEVKMSPLGNNVYTASIEMETQENLSSYTVKANDTSNQWAQKTMPLTVTITNCTTIDVPGNYHLDADIINSTASVCINITANNVSFDGQGHKIDGVDSSGSHGISISRSSLENTYVIIRECTLTDWYMGIYLSQANNNTIEGCNAFSNSKGVYLSYTYNNTIENSNISSNGDTGVYLGTSDRHCVVKDNTINSNNCGIRVSETDNLIENNTLDYNGVGAEICCTSAVNNTLYYNTIKGNDYGIELGDQTGINGPNTFYNNYINNTNNYYFDGTVYNNTWNTTQCGNWWSGFSDNSTACNDTNGDGICDNPYQLADNNTDYKPIAGDNWPFPGC